MIVGPIAARFGYRLPDSVRTLALLYDRALHTGRADALPAAPALPAHPAPGASS